MSNGRRGCDVERKLAQELRDRGYVVVRSAGSKGPIDLVVFSVTTDRVTAIQCKLTRLRKFNPARMAIDLINARLPASTRRELWVWVVRKGWHVFQLGADHAVPIKYYGRPVL